MGKSFAKFGLEEFFTNKQVEINVNKAKESYLNPQILRRRRRQIPSNNTRYITWQFEVG